MTTLFANEDVYGLVLSYLPDVAVGRLSQTDKERYTSITEHHWRRRLSVLINIDSFVIPDGVSARDLYVGTVRLGSDRHTRSYLEGTLDVGGLRYWFSNAAMYGCAEVIKVLLLDPNVDPSRANNIAIRWAAENGHIEVVKLLLADSRVDPSSASNDALVSTANKGHLNVVELLLSDPRADPSGQDNMAIIYAARNGDTDMVKLLLADPRVDPTAQSNRAIRWARARDKHRTVQLLLEDGRAKL